MPTHRRTLPPWPLATFLGVLVLLMSRGLLRGYSYWHDELFSIGAASASSWTALFRDWILPDTHPPLHLVLLRAWVALFGPGEVGTRLLSFVPAALALVAMALLTRGGGAVRQFVAVSFLGTSPLYVLQAQEVRPYAWGLLLVVLLVASMARLGRSDPSPPLRHAFRGSVLLLSLTHYFGLLFGLVVVSLDLLGARRSVGGAAAGLALLAAMTVWPVAHAVFGLGLDRTDWIDSTPVLDVWNSALNGVFPAASVAVPLALVLALIAWLVERRRGGRADGGSNPRARLRSSPDARELRLLLIQMLVFLLVVMVLDLRKPVAVERYFFVLLPSVALALGDVAQLTTDFGNRFARRAGVLVLTVILLMHLIHSQEVLAARIRPSENYKALARFLDREGVCHGAGCFSESARKQRLRPYFDAIDVRRAGKKDGAPSRGEAPLPFVGLHGEQDLIGPMLRGHPGSSCWEPVQSDRGSTYVILPADAGVPPLAYGLRPCRGR